MRSRVWVFLLGAHALAAVVALVVYLDSVSLSHSVPPVVRAETLARLHRIQPLASQEAPHFELSAPVVIPPQPVDDGPRDSVDNQAQGVSGPSVAQFNADVDENRDAAIAARQDVLRRRAGDIVSRAAQRMEENALLRDIPAYDLSEEDLLYLAEIVEAEALARTARIASRYELDKVQQAQVFALYAENSEVWHPALTVDSGGILTEPVAAVAEVADAATLEDELFDVLDEDQQEKYEDDWVERNLWWTEVIGKLEDELDEELADTDETVGSGSVAVVSESSSGGDVTDQYQEEPDAHPGGNVFDLLGL